MTLKRCSNLYYAASCDIRSERAPTVSMKPLIVGLRKSSGAWEQPGAEHTEHAGPGG